MRALGDPAELSEERRLAYVGITRARHRLYVTRAIMRAGGFSEFANKKAVRLMRKTADGKEQTFTIDTTRVMEKGKSSEDMMVQSEDVIIVGQRLINF